MIFFKLVSVLPYV